MSLNTTNPIHTAQHKLGLDYIIMLHTYRSEAKLIALSKSNTMV